MTTGRINQVTTAAPASGPRRKKATYEHPWIGELAGDAPARVVLLRVPCVAHRQDSRGPKRPTACPLLRSPACITARQGSFPKAIQDSPLVFHGPPSRASEGPPKARHPLRARSGAQSKGAPSPGGAAIQRSQSGGMHPRYSIRSPSQRPATHRAHPPGTTANSKAAGAPYGHPRLGERPRPPPPRGAPEKPFISRLVTTTLRARLIWGFRQDADPPFRAYRSVRPHKPLREWLPVSVWDTVKGCPN